jgi:putative Holliday junction resolvase
LNHVKAFSMKSVHDASPFLSRTVEHELNDAGLRGRRQKPALDQVAAQVILQSFLDMPQAAGIEPL